MRYWGPLASARVGSWIARATAAVMRDGGLAPDLCLTYLPTLDYDLQRFGPDAARAARALTALQRQLGILLRTAEAQGYQVLIFGDYAMADCSRGTAFPNRKLREAGLLKVRDVRGMLYPDLHASRAFAMVDHEVAHVFIRDGADVEAVREVLAELPGIESALPRDAQRDLGLAHERSGELVLVARDGHWLAYPWWTHRWQAPDYARHVDIHSKPGFDPCELFFGWPPLSTSLNTARVGGSHGRVGQGREVAWAATSDFPGEPKDLIALAEVTRNWLDAE
jgi:predicted AlkP superfamily pyrophosphatase or phosphodiesterase